MNRLARIIILTAVSSCVTANYIHAQIQQRGVYTDSLGKVYVKTQTPLRLLMGTDASGSNAVEIRPMDGRSDPLKWNSSGVKLLKHLDLHLGRNVNFTLHADGIAPQTTLHISQAAEQHKAQTIYIQGNALIELSAKDRDAGVQNIMYRVNGGNAVPYSQAFALEREGDYQIGVYSVDNLGNSEVEFTQHIVVDNTPPQTELSINGDRSGNNVSGRSQLALHSSDANGVAAINYQIDSTAPARYRQPIKTASLSEGNHIIRWHATDRVGNQEIEQEFTFFVDKTPPVVFEEIVGNSYMVGNREYSSGRSQLRVAAVDNRAGVRNIFYSLNDKEFIPYERPVTLSEILGTIRVKTYAVDSVNNRSHSGTSAESFTMPTIDITGPKVWYTIVGQQTTVRDSLWIGPKTKIKLNASDQEAGVSHIMYRIDNQPETGYDAPFSINNAGFYNIHCTAYDNVENLNLLDFALGVDNVPPTITTTFSVKPHAQKTVQAESVNVYDHRLVLFLAATDDICGEINLKYSLNGSKPKIYVNPIKQFRQNQMNSIKVIATDIFGNQSVTTLNFWVD